VTSRPAVLPEHLLGIRRTIATMEVGDSGWTWWNAMVLDTERGCWLNSHDSLNEESSCAAHIRVDRRTDGYHVSVHPRYRWELSEMRADRLAVSGKYFPIASISILEK